MKVIAVIPARYGSTRFLGKVLADVCGKTLINRVYDNVMTSKEINKVVVATDSKEVYEHVVSFGGEAVMTDESLKSGTERAAVVVKQYPTYDIIVNVQGDEPVVAMDDVDKAVKVLKQNSEPVMSTLYFPLTEAADIENVNIVKVIKDVNDFAIYFSRFPIPYIRDNKPEALNFYKHIGVYCYKRDFLLKFTNMPTSVLEESEKLEQLRVIENGHKIMLIPASRDTVGVDVKEDLNLLKKYYK